MRNLLVIAQETMLLLRRDRVFVPALIGGLLVLLFANLASDWGIEEFTKIVFDISAAGYCLIGSLVALFWGTKGVSDSRQEGSLEVQLASPVSRTSWLLGKYTGLAATLLLLAVSLAIALQAFMLLDGNGWMERRHVVILAFLTLGWLVVAALAVMLASFSSQAVAIFSGLALWVGGLISQSIVHALAPTTPALTRMVVKATAFVWDLQRFNLVDAAGWGQTLPSHDVLLWNAGYGVALIVALLILGCLFFQRRDLVG